MQSASAQCCRQAKRKPALHKMEGQEIQATRSKPALVIHIGAHKTGSTAIQMACVREWPALLTHGIYYPKDLFPNYPDQQSELAHWCRDGRDSQVRKAVKSIAKAAADHQASRVFLSGEEFWMLDEENALALISIMRKHFSNISYVTILRNREEYLLSNFKHHLRYSPSCSELDYINNIPNDPESVLKIWDRVLTSEKTILDYDKLRHNLVPQFFKKVFGFSTRRNDHENFSLDILTLQIYNIFLKNFSSKEIDAIMWQFLLDHPVMPVFPADASYGQSLARAISADGWDPAQLPRNALLGNAHSKDANFDPVEICDRMLDLFSRFRTHFADLKNQSDLE